MSLDVLPPEQWVLTDPPSAGQIAEAGVSWSVDRGEHTGWLHRATLAHAATGSVAAMAHEHREQAVHGAWVALHAMLTEDTDERTITT